MLIKSAICFIALLQRLYEAVMAITALPMRFYRFHRRFHIKDEQNGINL
jgi:hypothetical protein